MKSPTTTLVRLLPFLWSNWISLFGTAITTISGNVLLIAVVIDLIGGNLNPYASTFVYLVLPPIFILGLVLIAAGAWRHRRQERDSKIRLALDEALSDPKTRRRVAFVLIGTVVNVTIVSLVSYQAVSYTETTAFCGQLCHSVMEPEYAAYLSSPHARVSCAECHIGTGASWWVKSKLSGVRQVWAVMAGTYSRPIPSPVENLRPARETCEHCHWPAQFHGRRLLRRDLYQDDERNTRATNLVMLNIGGIDHGTGRYEGIHWHVSPAVRIEYESLNEKRTKIGEVTVYEHGKVVRVFRPKGASAAPSGKKSPTRVVHEQRTMDCVDCHNRPTHTYDPSPQFAVNQSMSYGRIDRTLPYLHKQAVALLSKVHTPREGIEQRFAEELRAFYDKRYPEVAKTKAKAIDRAAADLARIYRRNVYPRLNIVWGTYPSHLGHRNTQEGCFRCHDDEHQSADGKTIAQDCDLCHQVLAEEEEHPDVPEDVLRMASW